MAVTTRGEIRVGEIAIRFLLEGQQSDGSVAVFEFDVPAGSKVPAAHSHDAFEETIYGLEGTLVWTVEGQAYEVGPSEALCIPRGAVHQFANVGEPGAKGVGDRDPGHPRPRVLPGSRRGPRCGSRRPSRPGCDRGSDAPPRTHPRLLMNLPAATVIPLPSTRAVHAQYVLMVAFTSPDGRSLRAVGGGDTLPAAIAFAQDSCPTDATWEPISWSDLYGD